jgi:hypothetical protein
MPESNGQIKRQWMPRRFDLMLAIEYVFAAAILGALAYSFAHMLTYGYFPQPFFYDIGDAWMDWFNPAYWSHEPGTYDNYRTIYPPLTYVILRYITYGGCYANANGGWSRDCDLYGIFSLHAMYVLCIVLTAMTLYKVNKRTALPRSIAISMGLPMLWGLDRGNVILITYVFVVLAFGPLIASARLRWLFVGMAINMKVYLVGVLMAQLLHRRWRWFEGALIATILVYLVSYAIFGEGSPIQIYRNITDYADGLTVNNPLDLWMASSLLPLLALTDSEVFPALLTIGSKNVDLIRTLVPIVIRSAQALMMASAVFCFMRPEAVPRTRMIAISIGIALLSTEVSAYTQILVFVFVFMEPAKGFLRRYAILIAYILCIPLDINLDGLPPLVKDSFWLQRPVIVEYYVQLGPFLRPLLSLSVPVALAILTIIEVIEDICHQGWAARWRYRGDAPLLPWVRPPSPYAGRQPAE